MYRIQNQNPDPQPFWRRYDGSEECISSWQAAPIIFIILLLLLPLAMITRCMWLRGRMWRLETGGIVCRGWFWENSYYQFYSLSFQEKAPHWLPFQLCVRPLPLPPDLQKIRGKICRKLISIFLCWSSAAYTPPFPQSLPPSPISGTSASSSSSYSSSPSPTGECSRLSSRSAFSCWQTSPSAPGSWLTCSAYRPSGDVRCVTHGDG